ncbi:MAG TPA: Gfo/Idh/MocA family oxidoreductase [Planctomycetota bacterium]|nr:Gfo/Idh/MocA family oxidoreductase [Planctomycetota bacterium]
MKQLRFAAIGCGEMGHLHVQNANHVPGVKVVAFGDVRQEAGEKFLQRYGGEYATTDMDRIFADKSIDAVLIQTGEKHHPALGIAAAKADKHIFMEKPIAVTVEEALQLEKEVRRSKVKYIIGLCNRLAPAVKKAKEILPNPYITIAQTAHSVAGQACHNLDLIVHLFHEAPLQSVYASGGHYYGIDPHIPCDSFCAVLKFADGSQATYVQHGQAVISAMTKYSMQLFGRDRGVFLAKRYKECQVSTSLKEPDFVYGFTGPDFSPCWSAPLDQHFKDVRGPHGYMGHYDEIAELAKAIRNDTEPPMTVEHGRHVLQVEKAIFESLTTNTVVDYAKFVDRWGCKPLSAGPGLGKRD